MANDWGASERKIARRVFDTALHHELAEIMRTFKSMAANASEPDEMWATEEFLSKARHAIDGKYDFRYSQLDVVFGVLLREGRISAEDISGLSEEKINHIARIASL
ncbi:MAG: hypothetical protein WC742_02385 [Gallionellaceae bacterium]|jgi:hypothetical protein